jgi:uncharacterized membrane protein
MIESGEPLQTTRAAPKEGTGTIAARTKRAMGPKAEKPDRDVVAQRGQEGAMTTARTGYGMDTQTIIATFDGTDTAQQALESLQQLDRERWVHAMDAAVVVRDQDGKVTIRDTQDVDALHGAVAGVISGALVGAFTGAEMGSVGGPVGAATGAVAGGVVGGISAHLMDFGFKSDDLQAIAAELQPGTSALVAVVAPTVGDKLVPELEKLHGKIVRRALPEEAIAELKATGEQWRARSERQIQELNEQIAALQAQLATATPRTRADVQERLLALRAQREQAQNELRDQLAAQAQELERQRDDLRARLGRQHDAAKARFDERYLRLQVQVALTRAELADAMDANDQRLQAERERMQGRLITARDQMRAGLEIERAADERLRAQDLAALQAARDAAQVALREAIRDLKAAHLQAQGDTLQAISAQLAALQARLDRAQQRVAAEQAALKPESPGAGTARGGRGRLLPGRFPPGR